MAIKRSGAGALHDAQTVIAELDAKANHTVFVLVLSFEERCCDIPTVLNKLGLDPSKNQFLCIDLPDDNVLPVAATVRNTLRKKIEKLLGRCFMSFDTTKQIVETTAKGMANLVLDTSGMPRRVLFELLQLIAEIRPAFERVYLTYNHPQQYLLGEFEVSSPKMHMLYSRPVFHDRNRICLGVVPGFNSNETALAIAQVMDPTADERDVPVHWFFAHGRSHYDLYDRALGQHMPLLDFYRQGVGEIKRGPITDFIRISSFIGSLAANLRDEEVLILVNLGPRVICAPLFVASCILRRAHVPVNIMYADRLLYRSLRTRGASSYSVLWDMNEEYRAIVDALDQFTDVERHG